MPLVFFSFLLRQKQREKQKVYTIIHIRYVYLKEQCFLVVLSLHTEMLDWNMVKTKTLSWKKWKACSLSSKEMFRICNLAVKHFSLFQNDSDAEDYERTCVMEILPLKKFQRFLYYLRNDCRTATKSKNS